jgi:hypothetical protein
MTVFPSRVNDPGGYQDHSFLFPPPKDKLQQQLRASTAHCDAILLVPDRG